MPALSGLQNQMSMNPTQRESFDRNEAHARKIAKMVHLVHVSSTNEVSFDELLTEPPHSIPTSDHASYCSDATRRAEDLLGLARSAYFYAGRACPAFGDLALAFGPSAEVGRTVSVSSIDTGGLVHSNRYIKCEVTGADEDAARVEFGKARNIKEPDCEASSPGFWLDILSRWPIIGRVVRPMRTRKRSLHWATHGEHGLSKCDLRSHN